MKTKIVYALTSGPSEIYLPQMMISSYSARLNNPDAIIILVVDEDTSIVINNQLPSLLELISDLIIVDVPECLNTMQRSRYLKTTMRDSIEGDFLYIDTDTVICGDLSDIDDCPYDIAAVVDRHSNVAEHSHKEKISSDISKVGLDIDSLNNMYFNGGVIYVKDTHIAHKLFKEWNKSWNEARLNGISIDQPGLAKANVVCGYPIQEICGIWNCQLKNNFINYLVDAKILHYFASNDSSPYLLYNKLFYTEILENGNLTDDIKKLVLTPKSLFVQDNVLLSGQDCDIVNSKVFTLFKYKRKIYDIIDSLLGIIDFKNKLG